MRTLRIEPAAGQESVWDYPRPPRVEVAARKVKVLFNGVVVAESEKALRVLETSHPPCYYIPPEDVDMDLLRPSRDESYCEFKGAARYYDVLANGKLAVNAAWTYPRPTRGFEEIRAHLAFYAEKMDRCFVGDLEVQPQPGNFYGGWITPDVVGPFKGEPGTMSW